MKTQQLFQAVPKLLTYILLVSLAAALAGCAPAIPESTPSPTVTSAPHPTATPTPIPTETPIPTPTETQFVPKATIKIVVHVPLSGDQSSAGVDILHAAEFAANQLAGPLNELGYKVELVSYDDKMEVETAVANANEIIADPDILCGVGHYASGIMIQASELYHRAGLAFISPSNTNPTVTDRGYLEVNRVVGRNDGQGVAGAQFAKAQGFTSVYIIASSWDPGRTNAEYFKREASRIGLKVSGMLTTDVSDNFEEVIKRVMNISPDLVYFASLVGQAGPFFRQARAAGYTGAFLGIDSNPALADLAGPLLVEGGGMYYTDTAAPASYYPDAANFVQVFDNRYGASPAIFAAQAYDATGICIKAIEEASKAKAGELPTRAEVANAIRALVEYKGITGAYSFNKKGDPILAEYYIFKVTAVDASGWDQNTIVASFKVEPPK